MFFKIILTYFLFAGSWTLYRLLFNLPLWLEETVIKGLFFLSPLLILPLKRPLFASLGLTRQSFFRSVLVGCLAGLVLGLFSQPSFHLKGLAPAALGGYIILSLITAFWEQLLFSGYFLAQLQPLFRSELVQVSLVGLGFSLIHLPALILVQHLPLAQVLIGSGLLFTLGTSCAILRLRFNNLIAPIMAHALWGIAIFILA